MDLHPPTPPTSGNLSPDAIFPIDLIRLIKSGEFMSAEGAVLFRYPISLYGPDKVFEELAKENLEVYNDQETWKAEFLQLMADDTAAQEGQESPISDDDRDTSILKWEDFLPFTPDADFMDTVAAMPPRPWIIRNHLLRGYISAMFSPGGVGKSVFTLSLAVSVATGRDILGLGIEEQCNVLLINNEDDLVEVQRRLAAILQYHQIPPEELTGKLHIFSGYGCPFVVVKRSPETGEIYISPNAVLLKKFLIDNKIGLLSLDPFLSTHDAKENDNVEIDRVVKNYRNIAHESNCSVLLPHHIKKNGGNSEAHAGDAESGRGATALKDGARCVSTLAKMSAETGEKIDIDEFKRYIRLDSGKLNYGLEDSAASWFRMESVRLLNGDWVGVPTPVNLQPEFDSAESKDRRKKWTPCKVAEALHRIIKEPETTLTAALPRFKAENDILETQARDLINTIARDELNPEKILVNGEYFEYWLSKGGAQSSPIMIHRREL